MIGHTPISLGQSIAVGTLPTVVIVTDFDSQPIPHVDSAVAPMPEHPKKPSKTPTSEPQPPDIQYGEPYITWVRAGQIPIVPPGYTSYPMGTCGGAFILPDI